MKPLIIALLLMCCVALPDSRGAGEPPGQIAVFPSMFELVIGQKPVNQSIRLKNLKQKPVTIRTDVYNWTLDSENNLQTIPSTAQSLDRWIIINPLSFTVAPGQEQVVRFSIRPDIQPAPGEHRAIVYFTEQSDESEAVETVKVTFRIGVGIYGYADPVRRNAQLQSLTFDAAKGEIRAQIRNNGNVHTRLKGEYSVWKKGEFPGFGKKGAQTKPLASGPLNNMPVLPGENRLIETQIPRQHLSGPRTTAVSGELNGLKVEKIFP